MMVKMTIAVQGDKNPIESFTHCSDRGDGCMLPAAQADHRSPGRKYSGCAAKVGHNRPPTKMPVAFGTAHLVVDMGCAGF
jgi:hypothetical protein